MSDCNQVIGQMLRTALGKVQSGQTEESICLINEIRRSFAIELLPDVAARVICIEGICSHYSGDLQKSIERFRLAMAIARQYGTVQTRLFTSGWMALGHYNSGRFIEAANLLGGARSEIGFAEPDTRFRFASLSTMLHAFAGEERGFEAWFSLARREAIQCGEQFMTSALLYNVASLRVANAIVEFLNKCVLEPNRGLSSDLLFLRSSENYDLLVSVGNQTALHSLLQGQCLCLLGDYGGAIGKFQKFLDSECKTRASEFAKANFGKLLCQIMLGVDLEGSPHFIDFLPLLTDKDDLSYAHFVLSAHSESIGNSSAAARHMEMCIFYRDGFLSYQKIVLSALRSEEMNSLMRNWPSC
jgi:tetratricopeptide (TPR) repeat protein